MSDAPRGWHLLHSNLPPKALRALSRRVYGVDGLTDVNDGYLIQRLFASGLNWEWKLGDSDPAFLGSYEYTPRDKDYTQRYFMFSCHGKLVIEGREFHGAGASDNTKLDAAAKGAATVAFKNATKLAGMWIELLLDGRAIDHIYQDRGAAPAAAPVTDDGEIMEPSPESLAALEEATAGEGVAPASPTGATEAGDGVSAPLEPAPPAAPPPAARQPLSREEIDARVAQRVGTIDHTGKPHLRGRPPLGYTVVGGFLVKKEEAAVNGSVEGPKGSSDTSPGSADPREMGSPESTGEDVVAEIPAPPSTEPQTDPALDEWRASALNYMTEIRRRQYEAEKQKRALAGVAILVPTEEQLRDNAINHLKSFVQNNFTLETTLDSLDADGLSKLMGLLEAKLRLLGGDPQLALA